MHGSDISNKSFNPTFLFAIKYERTSNGYIHSHDYIELLYIYSGEGKYEINGTVYEVGAGGIGLIKCCKDEASHARSKYRDKP